MKNRAGRWVGGSLGLGLALLATGCGGSQKAKTVTAPSGEPGMGDLTVPRIDPELCNTSGKRIAKYDVNKDGKDDLIKLFISAKQAGGASEVLTCKQEDFDKDGKMDFTAIFAREGYLLAEEVSVTGRIDAREHYDR